MNAGLRIKLHAAPNYGPDYVPTQARQWASRHALAMGGWWLAPVTVMCVAESNSDGNRRRWIDDIDGLGAGGSRAIDASRVAVSRGHHFLHDTVADTILFEPNRVLRG